MDAHFLLNVGIKVKDQREIKELEQSLSMAGTVTFELVASIHYLSFVAEKALLFSRK